MKLVKTVKIKLNISVDSIKPTINAYTKAFNFVVQTGWDDRDFNGVSLHHKTYKELRKYLPAQLAISARMKATEALKSIKKKLIKKQKVSCPISKQSSIRYDDRSYNIWFNRNELSLLAIDGRIKIPITIPEYFKKYLTWKRGSAELFIKGEKVFLHITFNKEIEDTKPTGKVVGIDRGIKNIAVTSENKFYSGKHIKKVTERYEKLRSALQSCGTKSAKRHLRKISKKENRFKANCNHIITKRIVESLDRGSVIVLEKLAGIRQTARLRKKQRGNLHKWSFYQFEQFLTYKAEAKGIKVEYVDARYTSQKCSVCGHISRSNRQFQAVFKCKRCGFSIHADLNASRNIRQNYLDAIGYPGGVVVNQPIVTHVETKGSNE